MLDRLANPYQRSISSVSRQRRMIHFVNLIAPLAQPVHVLDVGGTASFWQHFGSDLLQSCKITLLNRAIPADQDSRFEYMAGDGCNLVGISDQAYDVVFSNSVIEHVGTWHNQQRMASEIQRVGKHHFVQTPNYYFPIEPHFLWPGLQYMPMGMRCWLLDTFGSLRNRKGRKGSPSNDCREIRLLKPSEMRHLFPQSNILHERFAGFSKSLMAIH